MYKGATLQIEFLISSEKNTISEGIAHKNEKGKVNQLDVGSWNDHHDKITKTGRDLATMSKINGILQGIKQIGHNK